MFEIIDQTPQEGAIIKVIGVGGCGGNAVEHMIDKGPRRRRVHLREHRRAGAQALDRARRSCSSAAALTRGLGAGARPEIGRDAAMEDRDRIAEMIDGCRHAVHHRRHGRRHGHRRGAGHRRHREEHGHPDRRRRHAAVPVRRRKRMKVAQAGIEELEKSVDSLIIIPNDKLMQVLGEDVSMLDAYAAANDVLHGAVSGIAEVINNPGPRQRRLRRRAHRDGRGRHGDDGLGDRRAARIARVRRPRQAVRSPLLEDVNLAGARGVLVNVTASSGLKMREYQRRDERRSRSSPRTTRW